MDAPLGKENIDPNEFAHRSLCFFYQNIALFRLEKRTHRIINYDEGYSHDREDDEEEFVARFFNHERVKKWTSEAKDSESLTEVFQSTPALTLQSCFLYQGTAESRKKKHTSTHESPMKPLLDGHEPQELAQLRYQSYLKSCELISGKTEVNCTSDILSSQQEILTSLNQEAFEALRKYIFTTAEQLLGLPTALLFAGNSLQIGLE